MKLVLVSTGEHDDYRVVAVFAASKSGAAAKVAALVGGRVENEGGDCIGSAVFPLYLNQFPAETPPAFAKAFYTFLIERSGRVSRMQAEPLLQPNGKLQEPMYQLDSYAQRAEKGYIGGVRKSFWQLYVACYADSEETAIELGRMLKDEVFKKAKPNRGTL